MGRCNVILVDLTYQLNSSFSHTSFFEVNRIYDGVEAETRKSQACFQINESYERLAEHKTNNLKTSLRFPCQGLNIVTDYFSRPFYSIKQNIY